MMKMVVESISSLDNIGGSCKDCERFFRAKRKAQNADIRLSASWPWTGIKILSRMSPIGSDYSNSADCSLSLVAFCPSLVAFCPERVFGLHLLDGSA